MSHGTLKQIAAEFDEIVQGWEPTTGSDADFDAEPDFDAEKDEDGPADVVEHLEGF